RGATLVAGVALASCVSQPAPAPAAAPSPDSPPPAIEASASPLSSHAPRKPKSISAVTCDIGILNPHLPGRHVAQFFLEIEIDDLPSSRKTAVCVVSLPDASTDAILYASSDEGPPTRSFDVSAADGPRRLHVVVGDIRLDDAPLPARQVA